MTRSNGIVYCLAPGAVESLLPAAAFSYAPTPGIHAVGFRATYAAGYATGINDPLRPDTSSYGAAPLPADIRAAAAYLAQERIAMQSEKNPMIGSMVSGLTTEIRVGERMQRYDPRQPVVEGKWALGFGTPLSVSAVNLLDKHRRRLTPSLIG